ncbi:type II secretion system minor pseudopilin GspK [Noviherbaspirillum massiliense]|uniref:type II secretion system minor pseudopilin GspK n=1 Tax=Noviherbaspirillum massiliense TaxID=1465823 RepID=UPI0002E57FE5|nr:type II secretion system minor pseudopilin GspK [Noviherbaspirillum massiliense]
MLSRERGVAIITALLLTTLAVTIVASLFWQQQVQVRSIENQRLQLQKQWILRGALDWTRLILREDARYSNVDYLGEPWAVSLAETRLDQYVENGRAETDVPDAAISGSIVDAQSRYNLTNLCQNGKINDAEVAAFARLLNQAQLNPSLAQATAELMASAQASATVNGGAGTGGSPQPLNIVYVDDLLAVPGFTAEALAKVRDFLVVLPRVTPVNVNTAPAEVLAARIEGLTLSEAAALVASRERTYFSSTNDFAQRLPGKNLPSSGAQIDVRTSFFLVNGNVRLNRAAMEMQTLIQRDGVNTRIVWIRES